MVDVRLVRLLGAVVVVLCSFAYSGYAVSAKPNPTVTGFSVITEEGTYTPTGGPSPIRTTYDPKIQLVATVEHAETVRFIASPPGHENPPFVIGPFRVGGSGRVAVDWTIPVLDTNLVLSAVAARHPDRPLVIGDAVDQEGNLVGFSPAMGLIYRTRPH